MQETLYCRSFLQFKGNIMKMNAIFYLFLCMSTTIMSMDYNDSTLLQSISLKRVFEVTKKAEREYNHWRTRIPQEDSAPATFQDLLPLMATESNTVLFRAIENNALDMVEFAVIHGADGNAALRQAVAENKINIVQRLLACGIDVNTETNNGYTPLLIAIVEQNMQMITLLESNGAKINPTSVASTMALRNTVQQLHPNREIIKKLLELGITPTIEDVNEAILHDNMQLVLLFLQYIKEVNKNSGNCPLQCAIDRGNKELEKILLDRGATINFPIDYQHYRRACWNKRLIRPIFQGKIS